MPAWPGSARGQPRRRRRSGRSSPSLSPSSFCQSRSRCSMRSAPGSFWPVRYYLPELNGERGKRSNDSVYWAFDRRKAAVMCGHDLRHTSGKGQPMNAFSRLMGGAVLGLALAAGLAAPAFAEKLDNKTGTTTTTTAPTTDIDFGDDSSEWSKDGECDDPRFEGTGSAAETLDADIRKDATDCSAAFAAGTVTLVGDQ